LDFPVSLTLAESPSTLTENEHFSGLIEGQNFAFNYLIVACFARHKASHREVLAAVGRHVMSKTNSSPPIPAVCTRGVLYSISKVYYTVGVRVPGGLIHALEE